jgi:hypothetical protein
MSEQSITAVPPSSQNAPQQVNPLETLLQVLSDVPSKIVLQEAATAKEATIDALIAMFEDIASVLRQANKRQRQVKRIDYVTSLMEQQSLDRDSSWKPRSNAHRSPTATHPIRLFIDGRPGQDASADLQMLRNRSWSRICICISLQVSMAQHHQATAIRDCR